MQTPPLKLQFDGLDDWQAGLQEYLLPVDCIAADPRAFRCTATIGRLRGSTAAELWADQSRLVRRPLDISGDKGDQIKVLWQLGGSSHVEQGRNRATLDPGQWTLCDPAREYAIGLDRGAHVLLLLLPRSQCTAWAAAVNLLSGRTLPGGGPAQLAAAAIAALLRDVVYLDPESERTLHDSVLVLLERAIALELEPHGHDSRRPRSKLLAEIKTYIREHLSDHSFTVDKVANAFGISRRSLYNAFAESGVTPHAYIQSARLDLAGRLLNQPGPRKASIAEVGRVCGYADAAHFSRSFHAHHGVPPRLWRSAAS
jgi:AraC-like DNA-binding protein